MSMTPRESRRTPLSVRFGDQRIAWVSTISLVSFVKRPSGKPGRNPAVTDGRHWSNMPARQRDSGSDADSGRILCPLLLSKDSSVPIMHSKSCACRNFNRQVELHSTPNSSPGDPINYHITTHTGLDLMQLTSLGQSVSTERYQVPQKVWWTTSRSIGASA